MGLLDDITRAEKANTKTRGCQACEVLKSDDFDAPVRIALERALAGTIGAETLAHVLAKNGLDVGRRSIERHRREEHGNG